MASFAYLIPYDFRVAATAELQIWRLIRHQKRTPTTRVRLVATEAAYFCFDLCVVR